jgi:hypothetical protein
LNWLKLNAPVPSAFGPLGAPGWPSARLEGEIALDGHCARRSPWRENAARKNLFMDVDHIPAGVDFVEYLHSQVAACDVFLAVIGPNWLDAKDDNGRRRFENPDDFVTIEIASALAHNIRVIPVPRLSKAARAPQRSGNTEHAIRPGR